MGRGKQSGWERLWRLIDDTLSELASCVTAFVDEHIDFCKIVVWAMCLCFRRMRCDILCILITV